MRLDRLDPRKLTLIIDGKGARPDAAEPHVVFRQAAEWFKLVIDIARANGKELHLSGSTIRRGSCVFPTAVNLPEIAEDCDELANAYCHGTLPVPAVLRAQVRATREARELLPADWTASSYIAPRPTSRQAPRLILLPPPEPIGSWASLTTLRVQIVTLHAGATPSATFASPSERAQFTVATTDKQIVQLGSYLYRPLDVELRLVRDGSGAIRREGSKLIAIHPMTHSDPTSAWREWLKKSAPEWNDILDVEGELGRETG